MITLSPFYTSVLFWFAAIIVCFWIGARLVDVGTWFYRANREANQHNKRIEFGSMIAAVLAVLISVAALGVALYGRDDLDARITKLEQASAVPKPNTPPAVKP